MAELPKQTLDQLLSSAQVRQVGERTLTRFMASMRTLRPPQALASANRRLLADLSVPAPTTVSTRARLNAFIAHEHTPAATGRNGDEYAVAGTAPAEIWAWAPRFGAQRTGLADVARAALEDRQAGLIVNPAGPSVTIPIDILRRLATP
jgi:hypothetical protein